jgi:hypothetical protein
MLVWHVLILAMWFLSLAANVGAMYRLGLRSTEISFYNNLKNENKC